MVSTRKKTRIGVIGVMGVYCVYTGLIELDNCSANSWKVIEIGRLTMSRSCCWKSIVGDIPQWGHQADAESSVFPVFPVSSTC